ncbi:MAG: N-acetylmuramoyl-L-alanine amidase [Micrococcales bacterium]|nr:N-acetylmuramoyl-L-alanine amidase [Micrococcales bacterium]
MNTTIRRVLVVGTVLAVGVWPLPAAGGSAVPVGAETAVLVETDPVAAAADPVQVDELVVEVDDPKAGSTTGGPTVDPVDDDTVVADRALAGGRVATEVVDTTDHQTVGVTWPQSEPGAGLALQMRSRTGGTWSEWTPMPVSDLAPDEGTADALQAQARAGTDPVWIGDADAVQLSVVDSAVDIADVRLAVIGSEPPDASGAGAPAAPSAPASPGPAPADGSASAQPAVWTDPTAARPALAVPTVAMATAPTLVTRAQWGAAAPTCVMDSAPLVGAVLHHTAGSNAYATTAAAMQQIRNDQRYHQQSRGWCDLGYNFVVDKWGNIYEGRAGSLTSSVIGVHSGGFNTGTVGVSMLGDYSSVTPSQAVVSSVARVVGWKLGEAALDPASSMSYYTGAGDNSRYRNQTVTLPRVFGHRDVAYTACPGTSGHAILPAVRLLARDSSGPIFVSPTLNRTSLPIDGSVTVSTTPTAAVDWTLTVTDDRTGVVMSTTTGRTLLGGLSATWDGRGPAGPVGPGPFRLTLTGKGVGTGLAANRWSTVVQVTGSQTPATVAAVPLTGDLGFVPVTPARLLDTRTTGQSLGQGSRLDLKVAGVRGVPADAKAVALNVTAVHASIPTFIRAWPAGAADPGTSMLNVDPSATTAAATVVGVGGEGKVSLRNNAGSVHLIVDVTGYYAAGSGEKFTPLDRAYRLMDTRTDAGLAHGQTRRVAVAAAGVPTNATAVVVNVTSAAARGSGHLVVVPAGGDTTATSVVNHRVGGDVANRATVPLSNGQIDVYLHGGPAGVVVDVVGWYGPSGKYRLTPLVPQRVVDTRVSGTPLRGGEARTLAVRGAITTSGTPAAALATITATQQTAPATYLTVGAAGMSVPPSTSDLNTGAGRDQAALAVLVWDSAGRSVVYNNVGSTHLVVDVNAVFR